MAVLFPYPLVGVAFASMLPVERLLAWRPTGLADRVRGYPKVDGEAPPVSAPDVVVHRVLPMGRHRSLDDYVAAGVVPAAGSRSTPTPRD